MMMSSGVFAMFNSCGNVCLVQVIACGGGDKRKGHVHSLELPLEALLGHTRCCQMR
jgi:hypothetical protein